MTKKTKETVNNKEISLKDISSKKKNIKKENKSNTEKISKKSSTKPNTTLTRKSTTKEKVTLSKLSDKVASATTKKNALSNVPVSDTSKKEIEKNNNYSKLIKTDYTPEYYDLPFRYNQTVVKILAQTPTNLFIYWDISDEDRNNLKKQYGEYFFEITKPVLVVHNETMNYSFEVDINDFANSWYLKVNDSNCEYKIELGRRPIPINFSYIPKYDRKKDGPILPIETPYIHISSSNKLESPNDKILFNKQDKVYFRNVKNDNVIEKDIKDFPFISKNNKFTSIYELYQELYKEEISNYNLDLNNPSQNNPNSGSVSSKFK